MCRPPPPRSTTSVDVGDTNVGGGGHIDLLEDRALVRLHEDAALCALKDTLHTLVGLHLLNDVLLARAAQQAGAVTVSGQRQLVVAKPLTFQEDSEWRSIPIDVITVDLPEPLTQNLRHLLPTPRTIDAEGDAVDSHRTEWGYSSVIFASSHHLLTFDVTEHDLLIREIGNEDTSILSCYVCHQKAERYFT